MTVLRSAVENDQWDAVNLLIHLGAHVMEIEFSCAGSMGMIELLRPHLGSIDTIH
jgi:hypothetical protein